MQTNYKHHVSKDEDHWFCYQSYSTSIQSIIARSWSVANCSAFILNYQQKRCTGRDINQIIRTATTWAAQTTSKLSWHDVWTRWHKDVSLFIVVHFGSRPAGAIVAVCRNSLFIEFLAFICEKTYDGWYFIAQDLRHRDSYV